MVWNRTADYLRSNGQGAVLCSVGYEVLVYGGSIVCCLVFSKSPGVAPKFVFSAVRLMVNGPIENGVPEQTRNQQ